MKSYVKKITLMVLCLTMILSLTACQRQVETIKVAMVLGPSGMSAKEFNEEKQQVQQEKINQFLEENEKFYRIEMDVIVTPTENVSECEELEQYDILYGGLDFSQDEMKERFVDLLKELREGELQPLYNSMPENYWKTLTINGPIYNTVRLVPPVVMTIGVDEETVKTLGVFMPEDMEGRPLQEWNDFFAEIYAANGNRPFMTSPFRLNYAGDFIGGNVWPSHFQMIAPHLGISYEEPELGVQCIYESTYGKEMMDLWKEYFEKGYLKISGGFDPTGKDIVTVTNGFNTQMTSNGQYATYPIEAQSYNAFYLSSYEYYQMLVTKGSSHLEEVYEFMNDMAQDDAFAQLVNSDAETGFFVLDLTPGAGLKSTGGMETFLTEPVEENRAYQRSIYETMEDCPVPGFVFDSQPVEQQLEAIDELYSAEQGTLIDPFNSRRVDSWDIYEETMETVIDQLYEAGLQEVIDEANRQIEVYQKE